MVNTVAQAALHHQLRQLHELHAVLSTLQLYEYDCAAVKRHSVPFRLSSVAETQELVSLTATADHRHVSLHTRHVGCLSLCVDKNAGKPTGQADPWMECMPGVLLNWRTLKVQLTSPM